MIQLTRKTYCLFFSKINKLHFCDIEFVIYIIILCAFYFVRDNQVEEALIQSLLWIEQLVFEFSSARYAVLRTFCVSAHKEEIAMRKFISSGVFVKTLVRLANRLFSNRK